MRKTTLLDARRRRMAHVFDYQQDAIDWMMEKGKLDKTPLSTDPEVLKQVAYDWGRNYATIMGMNIIGVEAIMKADPKADWDNWRPEYVAEFKRGHADGARPEKAIVEIEHYNEFSTTQADIAAKAAQLEELKKSEIVRELTLLSASLGKWAREYFEEHGNSFSDIRTTLLDSIASLNHVEKLGK